MKNLFYSIIILSLFNCSQTVSEPSPKLISNSQGEPYIAIVDDYSKLIQRHSFNLTKLEVKDLNRILSRAFDVMVNDKTGKYKYWYDPNFELKLTDYKRQYCPYLNDKGEKEVVVNCFCSVRNNEWKTKFRMVDGGGKCYFGGTINLNNQNFYGFFFNAPE